MKIVPVLKYRLLLVVLIVMSLNACSGSDDEGQVQVVNMAGKVQYEDREYSRYGFNGNTSFKAVRFATLDLVDKFNNIIDSTTTDETGNYALSGSGLELRVRILAETDSSAGAEISVTDYNGSVYAVSHNLVAGPDGSSAAQDSAEPTIEDLYISLDSPVVGAYNILDVLTNATQFVSQFTPNTLPNLQVTWQNKANRYGTYYCKSSRASSSCPNGKGIYLLGGTSSGGDSDHFDDDVIYHEYAHYVEEMLGISDSPGGVHYLTENDQDIRLSFSEGWGGFLPGAVKAWLAENQPQLLSSAPELAPTYFIDTYGSIAGISINVADPNVLYCPGGRDCFVYSTSEISVAKILNGVMSEFGMEGIWQTMAYYMGSGSSYPSSLETFWDGWMVQRVPADDEKMLLTNIFSERKVNFQHDSFESDNYVGLLRKMSVCVESVCDGEEHFLYQGDLSKDKDLIAFDVEAGFNYVVETVNLSNGADTYIRILNSFGSLVYDSGGRPLVNDDRPGTVYCGPYDNPCRIHNNATMLSSRVDFTPQTSGSYYAEVSTSSAKPSAAGRYGTYSLQITKQ